MGRPALSSATLDGTDSPRHLALERHVSGLPQQLTVPNSVVRRCQTIRQFTGRRTGPLGDRDRVPAAHRVAPAAPGAPTRRQRVARSTDHPGLRVLGLADPARLRPRARTPHRGDHRAGPDPGHRPSAGHTPRPQGPRRHHRRRRLRLRPQLLRPKWPARPTSTTTASASACSSCRRSNWTTLPPTASSIVVLERSPQCRPFALRPAPRVPYAQGIPRRTAARLITRSAG